MYMLPKSVLSTLPTGAEFISDGNHARLSGACRYHSGGNLNATGYALYAAGIIGGYMLAKSMKFKTIGKTIGAGIGGALAFGIELSSDMFCEGF